MSVTTVCFKLTPSKTDSGKSDQEASDQAVHTTYREPYKKSLTQNKREKKKVQENGSLAEK